MDILLKVAEVTAPVFILAAIGFAWVQLGWEYRVQFVTRLAMTLSVPCLVFAALVKMKVDTGALGALFLATLVAYGLVVGGSLALVLIGRLDIRTFLGPLVFGNTGNLGLPLALFAFGETGLAYAVVIFAIMAFFSFTFGVWIVSGGGSPAAALKEPLVHATVLGGIFLVMDWDLPVFALNTIELIGQMAIPLMLITLGVAVARLTPNSLGRAFLLSFVKLALCVGAGWLAADWFGLDPVASAVLVLQVATPVAVTSYLLAEKYGADAQAVAGLVVASTLLSVAFLPALLAIWL